METHTIFVKQPAKCPACLEEHRQEFFLDEVGISVHWCPHTRTCGAVFYGKPGEPPDYTQRRGLTASMANHWFNELRNGQLEMQRVITEN